MDFCGPVSHLRESTISDLETPLNFQLKETNLVEIGQLTRTLDLGASESHLWKTTISDFESPSNFKSKKKKIIQIVHKQGNWTFVVRE